ncbi:MAG: hypothetical protein AAF611_12300 [Bacteroidota bacterium]
MKKRSIKSLKLNKKSISNFKSNSVKGGKETLEGACIIGTLIAGEILSWIYNCNATNPVNSEACADTQNDASCQCTVA